MFAPVPLEVHQLVLQYKAVNLELIVACTECSKQLLLSSTFCWSKYRALVFRPEFLASAV